MGFPGFEIGGRLLPSHETEQNFAFSSAVIGMALPEELWHVFEQEMG